MLKPSEVGAAFARKKAENWTFRTYLKNHADPDELDEQFQMLHDELFAQYDCSQCRNCCKELVASIEEEEISPAAALLGLSAAEFKERYLKVENGEYLFKTKPCCFLDTEANCMIHQCMPETCRNYPYTNKPDRLLSMISTIESALICPVVFEMLERLKKIYHWRQQ